MSSVSVSFPGSYSQDGLKHHLDRLFSGSLQVVKEHKPDLSHLPLSRIILTNSAPSGYILRVAYLQEVLQQRNRLFALPERSGLLLLHKNAAGFRKIVSKFTGREAHLSGFCRLFPTLTKAAESTVVVSPMMFNGSGVKKEKALVKELLLKYGGLGFIKLPYLHLEQYLDFVQQTKSDLLILPKSELKAFLAESSLEQRLHYHSFSVFFG